MIPRDFGIHFLMFCVSLGFNILSVEMSIAEGCVKISKDLILPHVKRLENQVVKCC